MVLEAPPVAITSSTPARAESGAYRKTSFAIEPIQLPIVPLSLFWLQSLHTATARKHGRTTAQCHDAPGVVGMIAAQLGEGVGGAQIDGAAQLREARWELARQIIAAQPPAMCGTRASHHRKQ